VHDGIRLVLTEHAADGVGVGDVESFEPIVRQALDGRQAVKVRGIRQLVDVDELVLGVAWDEEVEKVGADEASTAGDEDPHDAPEEKR
jgi:hypothetical protein